MALLPAARGSSPAARGSSPARSRSRKGLEEARAAAREAWEAARGSGEWGSGAARGRGEVASVEVGGCGCPGAGWGGGVFAAAGEYACGLGAVGEDARWSGSAVVLKGAGEGGACFAVEPAAVGSGEGGGCEEEGGEESCVWDDHLGGRSEVTMDVRVEKMKSKEDGTGLEDWEEGRGMCL